MSTCLALDYCELYALTRADLEEARVISISIYLYIYWEREREREIDGEIKLATWRWQKSPIAIETQIYHLIAGCPGSCWAGARGLAGHHMSHNDVLINSTPPAPLPGPDSYWTGSRSRRHDNVLITLTHTPLPPTPAPPGPNSCWTGSRRTASRWRRRRWRRCCGPTTCAPRWRA